MLEQLRKNFPINNFSSVFCLFFIIFIPNYEHRYSFKYETDRECARKIIDLSPTPEFLSAKFCHSQRDAKCIQVMGRKDQAEWLKMTSLLAVGVITRVRFYFSVPLSQKTARCTRLVHWVQCAPACLLFFTFFLEFSYLLGCDFIVRHATFTDIACSLLMTQPIW